MIYILALLTALSCFCSAQQDSPYAAEMSAYFSNPTPPDTALCKVQTAQEKLFQDVFSFATLPYSQPIKKITGEDFPALNVLVKTLCNQYKIKEPMLFMACSPKSLHIDIKLCTLNKESALLIHPNTINTLNTRVFERYVEQAIMRIRNTITLYTEAVSRKKKKTIIAGLCSGIGIALAATLAWSLLTNYRPMVTGTSCTAAAAYGALLALASTKKHAAFSFQRISSFHNSEQAREDYFPPLSPDQKPAITENPTFLFGLDAIIKTQDYLKNRNAHFAELEKLERA